MWLLSGDEGVVRAEAAMRESRSTTLAAGETAASLQRRVRRKCPSCGADMLGHACPFCDPGDVD